MFKTNETKDRVSYSDVDLYLGSMNATYSAVNKNVEMMIRLRTKNRYYNSEMFLRDLFCGKADNPQNPFELSSVTEAIADSQQENANQLEQIIKTVCRLPMKASVTERDGKYDVSLEISGQIPEGNISITPFRRNVPIPLENTMFFSSFRSRVNGERKRNLMRAHYAVGFVTDGDDAKKADRKNSIRGAFNSPLRPFVLASTSIGQEGLDFHNYCRKIMHWNLPSNPIDLEQREGRINRFKCLAIRQNVARKYGNVDFDADIWTEMFAAAQAERKQGQSELVPFWCFGEGQEWMYFPTGEDD